MKIKKSFLLLILSTLALLVMLVIYFYNIYNFRGTVTNKYMTNSPIGAISLKTRHVVIKNWQGEKDFVINDEEDFDQVTIGGYYHFHRTSFAADWVELKN